MRALVAFGALSASLTAPMALTAPVAAADPGAARDVSGRLYSRGDTTWIWSEPSTKSQRLGFVRVGGSVRLRDTTPERGPGCSGGFLPVEPKGFVCQDRTVTLDADYRYVRALERAAPRPGAMPFSYAISNGAPMYRRLPTPEGWQRAERDLGPAGQFKKYPWNERHERLAEVRAIAPTGPIPFFLREGGSARADRERELVRMLIPLGTMIAYASAFSHEGRTWLLTPDGFVVPADRVRPYRGTTFRGLRLGKGTTLPLASVNEDETPKFRRLEDGSFRALNASWNRWAWVPLESTKGTNASDEVYLPTTERVAGARAWIQRSAATVVKRRKPPSVVSGNEKWIGVSIRGNTLVAYEGSKPVFATLISPGSGGLSRPGADPVKASTTPRGTYRIHYKYRTQTMSPQKDKPETERTFWIAEVPFVQYFRIPFAVHAAYWHEDFGAWMSGGCVNVSPEDGKWLFEWTDPTLPEDWHGVWAGNGNGRGTVVVIGR